MSKKTYYFPHDGNARNDEKILAVRMRFGMEGYGIYFALIEKLLESSDYILLKDYNAMAFELRVDASKIKSIVEDFGLFVFTEDGKYFYSESFNKRMNPLEEIRDKRREAGKKGAEKRWEKDKKMANAINDNSKCHDFATPKNGRVKKSKEENIIIPPKPPKGEGINKKARSLFEGYFRDIYSDEYYWSAKDAGSMSQLIKKLTFSRKSKGMSVDDDSVLYALKVLLSSIKDGWIFDNFSVANINSKYNEIISQARENGKSNRAINSKQEANEYAMRQFIERRQQREAGMAKQVEKPF